MDYEKKYKEALDLARSVLKHYKGVGYEEILPYAETDLMRIFPELKESEDERIRKELIKIVNDHYSLFKEIDRAKTIAWLEKQGEHANFRNKIQIGDKVTMNRDGVLVNLSQLNRVAKKDEKQGEQKPIEKIEPKFHEGDWTVSNLDKKARQISEVHFDEYNSYYVVNGKSVNLEEYDRLHHLWTIQDAKDGDVLNSTRVQATIIFKGFAEDGKHINAYCALQSGIFIHQEILWDRDFEPASKNWKNALFGVMKEAGYEWDADKLELKKIEQGPAECLCVPSREIIMNVWELGNIWKELTGGNISTEHGTQLEYIQKHWAEGDYFDKIEQKPAWSEEDESYLKSALWHISYAMSNGRETSIRCDLTEWLKSLKDRISQPKQEWSEEDKKMLDFAIRAVGLCKQYAINHQVNGYSKLPDVPKRYEELQNWLKSLKERVQPKQEWSEEDENLFELSLSNLTELKDRFGEEYGRVGDCIAWLKSLKDRVQPQTHHAWSEEDEQYLLVCKNALAKYQKTDKWDAHIIFHWLENKLKSPRPQPKQEILEKLEEWLDEYVSNLADVDTASLIGSFTNYLDGKLPVKPKNRWKPSDEQMNALRWVLNNVPYNKHKEEISGLLDQIKEL